MLMGLTACWLITLTASTRLMMLDKGDAAGG